MAATTQLDLCTLVPSNSVFRPKAQHLYAPRKRAQLRVKNRGRFDCVSIASPGLRFSGHRDGPSKGVQRSTHCRHIRLHTVNRSVQHTAPTPPTSRIRVYVSMVVNRGSTRMGLFACAGQQILICDVGRGVVMSATSFRENARTGGSMPSSDARDLSTSVVV